MSNEENIDPQDAEATCIVCGKTLKPGEALGTIHESGTKLPICCPLCLEAYQKDPKPHLERLVHGTFREELRRLTRSRDEI